ncbi:MAG TPA: hypothetical protein DIV86_07575 [Alphaproteobacteria bacterium]|nr:hypothetical protein [Alphaproteobacteria bacterium]
MASIAYSPKNNFTPRSFFVLIRDVWDFFKKAHKNAPHVSKSFILHLIILIGISGALPTCQKKIEAPKLITVDIMPLSQSEIENQKPPVPKSEEKKQEVAVKKDIKSTVKTEKAKEVKQEAREQEKKREFVQTPEEKKPEVKKVEQVSKTSKLPPIEKPQNLKKTEIKPVIQQKPNEKNDEEDAKGKKSLLKDVEKKETLDDIFDTIEDTEKTKSTAPAKPVESNSSKNFVPDANFVNEIMGKIQSQVTRCWNIPAGVKNAASMTVDVYIKLDASGYVTEARVVNTSRYNSDNFFRVLADSAIWAVKECSPLQGLPVDKHEFWQEIELTFDPSKVL